MATIYRDAKIRAFQHEDIEAATEILLKSPGAAPWSRASHEKVISDPSVLGLVCESNSRVTAFIIARQIADEAEVLNLAVAPNWRHAGLGSALLAAALEEFRRRDAMRVFLEVRESNSNAIAFYEKHGFLPAGRRKAYYRDPVEDAICMEKKLTP